MGTIAPAPSAAPRLTVGGFRRRTMVVPLAIFILVGLAVAWVVNYAPLTVDTTVTGVSPDVLLESVDATAPTGEAFTEYRLGHSPGETFSFSFWIHNEGPLPVTLTSVPLRAAHFTIADITMRPTSGDSGSPRPLPYTIPAHEYVELDIRGRFSGCMGQGESISLGSVPVSYELFGIFPRHGDVQMPMTISIVGRPGAACEPR